MHTDNEEKIPENPPTGAFSHDVVDGVVSSLLALVKRWFSTDTAPAAPVAFSDDVERYLISRDLHWN